MNDDPVTATLDGARKAGRFTMQCVVAARRRRFCERGVRVQSAATSAGGMID